MVIDQLDAIVQIGELILLGAEAVWRRILYSVLERVLLVLLLALLLVLPLRIYVVLLVRVGRLAKVCVNGGYDELVYFE